MTADHIARGCAVVVLALLAWAIVILVVVAGRVIWQ